MKYIFLITLFFFITFIGISVKAITRPEKSMISNKLFTVALDCIKSNPLTFDEMNSFKNKTVPDGKNPKCFIACVYKKIGIMDEMGKLSPMGAQKKAEMVFKGNEAQMKNVEDLMQSCTKVNNEMTRDGAKGCDRAKLAHICLMENGPKYGFDFDF